MSNAQSDWSRVPYKIRQQIKSVLLARDGLICCVCGTRIASAKVATIEHKRERSAGGSLLDYANLGLAHRSCNFGRHGTKVDASGGGASLGTSLVSGGSFFRPRSTEHPAPAQFFPPPAAQKKRCEQG